MEGRKKPDLKLLKLTLTNFTSLTDRCCLYIGRAKGTRKYRQVRTFSLHECVFNVHEIFFFLSPPQARARLFNIYPVHLFTLCLALSFSVAEKSFDFQMTEASCVPT